MAQYLEIVFSCEVSKTLSGWSPGGAVFPDNIVKGVNGKKNSLLLMKPTRVRAEGNLMIFEWPDGSQTFVRKEKIKEMNEA